MGAMLQTGQEGLDEQGIENQSFWGAGIVEQASIGANGTRTAKKIIKYVYPAKWEGKVKCRSLNLNL